jgi:hypothetical protein
MKESDTSEKLKSIVKGRRKKWMKVNDRSSKVDLDRLRKEKSMKCNDRSDETEIDH